MAPDRAFQEMLAEYLESQASWREMKAEDYPEDGRNRRCAEGLKEAASTVRSLAPQDERLVTLEGVHDDHDTGVFWAGEETSLRVGRFRFSDPSEDVDSLLKELPSLVASN